ncbi:MAG: CapA family protein [Bacteroidales bacterium]|nr:CapA family protein [Bacteroidales bacterium]
MAGGLLLKPSAIIAQDSIQDKSLFRKMMRRIPPVIPSDTIRLVFIGDVMMHTAQLKRDFTPFLQDLKPLLSGADVAIANMEFPLGGEPHSGYPAFSAPDSIATYVAGLGADVFLTANNHILDKGTAGLERTLRQYGKIKGVKFTGTASEDYPDSLVNPLIIISKGAKIALVNFTYGTNAALPWEGSGTRVRLMKKEDTSELFERARSAGADFIIALPHWGDEYSLKHNKAQKEYAEWMAGEGAGVIIGTHPHVVQDTCSITAPDGRKVPVIYSLGNAVSNMSAPNTRLELAATVSLVRNFLGQVSLHDIQLEWLWCTLPGRLEDNYRTVRVREMTGRSELWKKESDYKNMISTLERVKEKTGIGK